MQYIDISNMDDDMTRFDLLAQIHSHDPIKELRNEENHVLTYAQKRDMINEVLMLDTGQHIEVLNIINDKKIEYTENKNGIFINMSIISDDILWELYTYIKSCRSNNIILNQSERIMKELESVDNNSCENEDQQDTSNCGQFEEYDNPTPDVNEEVTGIRMMIKHINSDSESDADSALIDENMLESEQNSCSDSD